jgi:hypothetical protein
VLLLKTTAVETTKQFYLWSNKMKPEMVTGKASLPKLCGKVQGGYLDEKQASEFLNMSVNWLRKCRFNGTGPTASKFGASVRYSIVDMIKYTDKAKQKFTGQTQT